MADNDVATRLRQVPRFADLSEKELKQVGKAGTYLHQPANWTLMAETTPADKAYVILSGSAEVKRHGETVATVGAGDVIGEVGILEHRLRTAAVVSTTELEVVHFTRENLEKLVGDIPALAAALRATAEERLADDQG